jgi:hypothetical protein
MNTISLLDLVYIAGFLDGDGSIIAQLVRSNHYKWGYNVRVTVQFTQHTKRLAFLNHLRDIIGVGSVKPKTDPSTVADYVITDVSHVYKLLGQLQPFLKIKQKQANLVIRLIEQMPLAKDSPDLFIKQAQLVDQVAALNDSKNRIHTSQAVIDLIAVINLTGKLPELPKSKKPKAISKRQKNTVVPVETS